MMIFVSVEVSVLNNLTVKDFAAVINMILPVAEVSGTLCCLARRNISVGDRGVGGLQPSRLWKTLQKLAIIGQKIALKSGKIFVNNGSSIGQPP